MRVNQKPYALTKEEYSMIMRLSSKVILLLLIFTMVVFPLAGCKKENISVSEQNIKNGNASEGQELTEETVLNVAAVKNNDLLVMKELSREFTQKTGVKVKYNFFGENELRKEIIEDVRIGGGKYDVVAVGAYDVPLWGQNQIVECLEPYFYSMLDEDKELYNRDDFIFSVTRALSHKGDQYALPIYGESSILLYRKDLFEEAGLKMPETPSWHQVYEIAGKLHNPSKGIFGIVLRGLPGWGQNMAVFGSMINTFGARWFDILWQPQFKTDEMKSCWEFYKRIITEAGQPDPVNYGYKECLELFSQGKGAMWYDTTGAASVLKSRYSSMEGKVGYAPAPVYKKENAGWLWAWSLAIETSSRHKDEAFEFITWATSKYYVNSVGNKFGWEYVPQGTRISTYNNLEYKKVTPFAGITLKAIANANYGKPTLEPVPYVGVQYIPIPGFRNLGDRIAEQLALYVAGKKNIDEALETSQEAADEAVKENGYEN